MARRARRRWLNARLLLAGEEDSAHPNSVRADWVKGQQQIEFHGRIQDVLPILLDADMFLFHSYWEGVPRAVLEAASKRKLTVAQKFGETCLLFLVHPTLGRENMNTIIDAVGEVMELSVR